MSEGKNLSVIMSSVFHKALKKLSKKEQNLVDDEVEKIIENPEIGELKKGDLSHMRVHKFKMNKQLMLLGYSYVDDKLTLFLLNIGSHENFYDKAKNRRESDLNLIS